MDSLTSLLLRLVKLVRTTKVTYPRAYALAWIWFRRSIDSLLSGIDSELAT